MLVLGLGNPDRGDDGIGVAVADALARRLPAGVVQTSRRGDMLSLIEDWAGYDALICIDAAAPMGEPGSIHRLDLQTDDLPRDVTFLSSHAIGLGEAIALARILDIAPREIVVYAIEGLCYEAGAPITPAVAAAITPVADRVAAEAVRLRENASHA